MEEEDIVLACTACKMVYLVAVLDQAEGILQPQIPGFCPFCGQRQYLTDAILTTIQQRGLKLIPGGKTDRHQ